MNPHFGDALTDRLAIPKVAMFRCADTMDDTSTAYLVFERGKPSVKIIRTKKCVHTTQCIQIDTDVNLSCYREEDAERGSEGQPERSGGNHKRSLWLSLSTD